MKLQNHLRVHLINYVATVLQICSLPSIGGTANFQTSAATTSDVAGVAGVVVASPSFPVVSGGVNKRVRNASLETPHRNSSTEQDKDISKHASTHDYNNYNKPPKACLDVTDCDSRRGETCRFLYDGCNVGQCMCESDLGQDGVTERCHNNDKRYLNDSCTGDMECIGGMQCRGGACRCSVGGTPTEDGRFCVVERRHRVVGSPCNPSLHACLQKAIYGYTSYDVECDAKRSVCSCVNGFKTEGITCSRSHQ